MGTWIAKKSLNTSSRSMRELDFNSWCCKYTLPLTYMSGKNVFDFRNRSRIISSWRGRGKTLMLLRWVAKVAARADLHAQQI